jgi:hypothetical protein
MAQRIALLQDRVGDAEGSVRGSARDEDGDAGVDAARRCDQSEDGTEVLAVALRRAKGAVRGQGDHDLGGERRGYDGDHRGLSQPSREGGRPWLRQASLDLAQQRRCDHGEPKSGQCCEGWQEADPVANP